MTSEQLCHKADFEWFLVKNSLGFGALRPQLRLKPPALPLRSGHKASSHEHLRSQSPEPRHHDHLCPGPLAWRGPVKAAGPYPLLEGG